MLKLGFFSIQAVCKCDKIQIVFHDVDALNLSVWKQVPLVSRQEKDRVVLACNQGHLKEEEEEVISSKR